jgi:D-tagatose-1,6-bisphosphate aldolase subunit GatZ/KbaZ
LVRNGFAILKVGPALTFAMREALDALSFIEAELVPADQRANLPATLEQAMLRNPRNWEHHYEGDDLTRKLLRHYSYSDRVRYYWNVPEVRESVEKLMRNLQDRELPETLLSAFLPDQYVAVRAGSLKPNAHALILDRIRQALRPYAQACNA